MVPLTLRGKALAWLAQREHSKLELQQKLERYAQRVQANPDDIAPVIDALEAAGHLSETRFIESRVNARLSRFGNRRIEQELRAKGVAPDETLRSQLRDSELMRARRVFEAKFGRQGDRDSAESSHPASKPSAQLRARQARFLAARGFSAATVAQVLKGAGVAEEASEEEEVG